MLDGYLYQPRHSSRGLSILVSVRQLVCRPYLQTLQDRIKQHVSKFIRSSASSQKGIFFTRQCKSSTQPNTQTLASDSPIGLIFYKILSVLNIKLHSHGRLLASRIDISPFFLKLRRSLTRCKTEMYTKLDSGLRISGVCKIFRFWIRF